MLVFGGNTTQAVAPLSQNVYELAGASSLKGPPHTIAILRLPGMGNHEAQHAVQQVFEDCPRVQHVIFCGIAGAAPNPRIAKDHVRLGDIVVGTEGVIPYRHGKETDDDFEIRGRILAPRPGNQLVAAARRLQGAEEASSLRPWDVYTDQVISQFPNSQRPADDDKLIEQRNFKPKLISRLSLFDKTFEHPYDDQRLSLGTKPRVFFGVVASANIVQANAKSRDRIRDRFGARCFEMEGYGLQFSAEAFGLNALVVRGTADYCNAKKNRKSEPQWQRYAAVVAAAYTRSLVEQIPNGPPRALRDASQYLRKLNPVVLQQGYSPEERPLVDELRRLLDEEHLQDPLASTGPTTVSTTDSGPPVTWSQIHGLLDEMEVNEKNFDVEKAFDLSDRIERLLDDYPDVLSGPNRRSAYFRIAKISVLRADLTAHSEGRQPDYARSQEQLRKARNE